MTIDFEEALRMQDALQAKTYGRSLRDLPDWAVGEQAMIHATALTDEVHEALRETPWKPWKRQQAFDRERYREEMVDAFHFFMNMMLLGDISVKDLLRGYEEKHAENIRRQRDGY